MRCVCRFCKKEYEEGKSTAGWTGYCSCKCQHEMAHKLGYRPGFDGKSEYDVLHKAKAIGSVKSQGEKV